MGVIAKLIALWYVIKQSCWVGIVLHARNRRITLAMAIYGWVRTGLQHKTHQHFGKESHFLPRLKPWVSVAKFL